MAEVLAHLPNGVHGPGQLLFFLCAYRHVALVEWRPEIAVDIITAADKLACAERELKMRQRVYPRWIEGGRMSAGKAAHETAVMEAIVADYRAMVEKDRLI